MRSRVVGGYDGVCVLHVLQGKWWWCSSSLVTFVLSHTLCANHHYWFCPVTVPRQVVNEVILVSGLPLHREGTVTGQNQEC